MLFLHVSCVYHYFPAENSPPGDLFCSAVESGHLRTQLTGRSGPCKAGGSRSILPTASLQKGRTWSKSARISENTPGNRFHLYVSRNFYLFDLQTFFVLLMMVLDICLAVYRWPMENPMAMQKDQVIHRTLQRLCR